MTRRWIVAVALLLAGTFLGGAAADDWAGYRVWVERGTEESTGRMRLVISHAEGYLVEPRAVFSGALEGRDQAPSEKYDGATIYATLSVTDAAQAIIYAAEAVLDARGGKGACEFVWDVAAIPAGSYPIRIVWRDRPEYILGRSEWMLHKVSVQALKDELAEMTGRLTEVRQAIDQMEAGGTKLPYPQMRVRIASDFNAGAIEELSAGSFRLAYQACGYLRGAIEALRAQVTFASLGAEREAASAAQPSKRPAFLFGWAMPRPSPEDLARIAGYGLNFVVADIAPRDTLLDETANADLDTLLGPFFAQAKQANVSVAINLAIERMPDWALAKWPEMVNAELGGVDIASPAAKGLTERHLRVLLPYLASQEMLVCVCLADRPRFRFEGEDVRQGFIASVQQIYPDRHALNRSWKSHLVGFEAIDIGPAHLLPDKNRAHWYQQKCAFQYDWQTYHQKLGTEYCLWLSALAREVAPDLPLTLKLANTMLGPGGSRWGIDFEALAPMMNLSGCTSGMAPVVKPLAGDFVEASALYTFLHSMAPGKPVVDLESRLVSGEDRPALYTRGYVHTGVWQAALAGLSASAEWAWDRALPRSESQYDLFSLPGCVEGYAQACLDLNRLSDIVLAFQAAPVDVTILWSPPAQILFDGDPFVVSARKAFEGCMSSGYNVGFLTQRQCVESGLAGVKVLVVPQILSLSDDAFRLVQQYIESGGLIIRASTPIPYNERGHSRHDSLGVTQRTLLVRGQDEPSEYLHALDAAIDADVLPPAPRPVTEYGYPVEGVASRYIELDETGYLYLANLRSTPVTCRLTTRTQTGHDLIAGNTVTFPITLEPMTPLLVRLNK